MHENNLENKDLRILASGNISSSSKLPEHHDDKYGK